MSKARFEKNLTERLSWYTLPLGDVFMRLNSKRDGLSEEEAQKRLKHFGRNEFTAKSSQLHFKNLAGQFLNPLVLILFAAGILMILVGLHSDAIIIFAIIFLMGLAGFYRQRGIEKKLESLKRTRSEESIVLRDGIYGQICSKDIVPGDVVLLRPGDKIPGDARIVQSYGFKMDESALWPSFAYAEPHGVIFGGSFVTQGTAEAVVFGTGLDTEIFRTARTASRPNAGRTTFDKKISKLGKLIGAAVAVLSAIIFIFGLITGRDLKDIVMAAMTVAVAAVPEGLLVTTALAISAGLNKIFYFGGLARSARAIEAASGVSVIVTDRSGMFFEPEARVLKILTPERRSGILELSASVEYASNHILTLTYGLLAAEVAIENRGDDASQWAVHGGRIDTAIVRAAISAGLDIEKLLQKFKRVGHYAFSSDRKFALTFRKNPEGETWAIAVGSPDALMPRVKKIQVLNRFENAISFEMGVIKESVDSMAKSGLTVLAVCSKKIEGKRQLNDLSEDESFLMISDLNLVGLIGLKNDLCDDAADILSQLRRAGIRIVMATGEHTLAAKATAVEIGIVPKNRTPEILEGLEIQAFDFKELSHRISNVDVFSRSGPEQKLKIIEAWQSQDSVVAFVGDGPDDVAGLKQANLSVSVPEGADISKEYSDLTLGGDKLKTLFLIIKEGRAVFENIRKSLVCLLSASFAQVILIGFGFLFKLPIPLMAIQILWLNIIQIIFPTMALAIDQSSPKTMEIPPRDPKKPAIDKFIGWLIFETSIFTALILFGIFYFFNLFFDSVGYAQTVTFAALGINILFFAFSARCLSQPVWDSSFSDNKILLISAAAGTVMLAMAVYFPPLEALLKTQPIGILEWVIIFCSGILNVLLIETGKWVFVKKMLI